MNPESGAISPDQGNHAIKVTGAGRTHPAVPRSVRYLFRHLACAWLGGRCGAVCSAADYIARLPRPAAAVRRGCSANGLAGRSGFTFRDEDGTCGAGNRLLRFAGWSRARPWRRAGTDVVGRSRVRIAGVVDGLSRLGAGRGGLAAAAVAGGQAAGPPAGPNVPEGCGRSVSWSSIARSEARSPWWAAALAAMLRSGSMRTQAM